MRLRTAILCLLFFVFALSGSATFAQVPFVAQPLAPAAAAPGGAAFTLTVNGAGFVSASVVLWNGSRRPTTFVSGSQLTAAIGASDIATAGTAVVTVFNAANTGTGNRGGTSNAVFFQVTKATSAVNYNSANVSAGGQTLVGDFNGDGKQDLAILNNDASVSILLGNGDGTFQPASVIPPIFIPGSITRGMVLGDFNGDGKLDIAATIQYFDDIQGPQLRVYVYFGQGNGNFSSAFQGIAVGGSTSGSVLLVADLNGDGNLDLLMDSAGPYTYGVVLWLGHGDGTFTQSDVLNPGNPSFGTSINNVAVGDLNRDGRIDRVVTYQDQSGNATLAVLLNGGIGCGLGCPPPPTLTTVDSVAPPAGGRAYFSGIAIADFDGNGIPDLATNLTTCNSTGQCTTSLRVYSGKGDGTFQPPVTSSTPPGNCCIVGDFNGDGILDVVVANQILLGQGNGTFAANPVALPHGAFATADFNADGTLDFVGPGILPDGSSGTFLMLQRGNHPDFAVTASPGFQSVAPGGSISYTVQVTPIQGWNTDVALSVSGLPGGATASFQPATVTGGNGSSTLTILTTTAVQPGRYGLTVTGTAGSVSYNLSIPFEVGTFSVFAQASIDVVPGGSTSVLVQERPSFGWTGDVTFSVSGLPSGVTGSFQPVTVTGGAGQSTLTISAPTNIAPGTYPITITGTAASGISRSVSVNLVVPPPDFFLSGSFFVQTVIPVGGSASYTIQVSPFAGWNRDVTLSLSGLPSGATASFQPATVAGGSGTSVLTVTTANVVIDPNATDYVLLITGKSSIGVSHTTYVLLTVADFSLSASPASQRVVAGASTSFTVQGTATTQWRLDVPLSISGLPNGATASFSPDRIFSGRSSSSLAISTTTATPAGTYPLTITGTGGGGSHSVTVSLMVTGFVVSVPMSSHQLAAGQSIDYRVQVTPLPGWTGDVTLSVSGLPSGATASFNPATIPGGSGNSDLAITTTTGVTPGTYSLTVSGSGGGSVRSVVITFVVQPPGT